MFSMYAYLMQTPRAYGSMAAVLHPRISICGILSAIIEGHKNIYSQTSWIRIDNTIIDSYSSHAIRRKRKAVHQAANLQLASSFPLLGWWRVWVETRERGDVVWGSSYYSNFFFYVLIIFISKFSAEWYEGAHTIQLIIFFFFFSIIFISKFSAEWYEGAHTIQLRIYSFDFYKCSSIAVEIQWLK